jgi:predicted DCC family thiol-disulfide oxidoreductase YuxK
MTQPIVVFHDGVCQLCSREISLLEKLADPAGMQFVDIANPAFDAAAHGVDPLAVHRHMHVRDAEGNLQVGLDALITMWRPVPYFRHLAFFSRLPGFYTLGKLGYAVFAWVRPKLPRRKPRACPVVARPN